jgi:hypothetical protein
MRTRTLLPVVATCLPLLLLLSGCAPSDPAAEIRAERARWSVLALEWVRTADGSIQISTRVSGPPNSTIGRLTVRVDLLDTAGETLRSDWHAFDLNDIPRGGPADRPIRLEPLDGVEGVSIDLMGNPTEDEIPHITELADAGSAG